MMVLDAALLVALNLVSVLPVSVFALLKHSLRLPNSLEVSFGSDHLKELVGPHLLQLLKGDF